MFRRFVWCLLLAAGCRSPDAHRSAIDTAANDIIAGSQRAALGRTERFSVEPAADTLRRRLLLDQELPHAGPAALGSDRLEPPADWPESERPEKAAPPASWQPGQPLSLLGALGIAARNSREYQDAKEDVFRAALDLELERDRYRNTFLGTISGLAQADRTAGGPDGLEGGADLSATRLLRNGAAIAAAVGLDLVKLLTGNKDGAYGLFGDASLTIPLLRGAGKRVVTEPLTQAEREVVYALRSFDRFRRAFAVRVASGFFDVLELADRVRNAEENYRGLVVLSRRTRALDRAGRISGVQVDQALQDELRARDRWIAALQALEGRLDTFKESLGLPPDADFELDRVELERLSEAFADLLAPRAEEDDETIPAADAPVELEEPTREGGGRFERAEGATVARALERRQDLRVLRGRVEDAQRGVVVAADALRAGLTLTGGAAVGGRRGLAAAPLSDGPLRAERGVYTADLLLDLPLERTAEAVAYRESFLGLEQAVRDLQELEDRIKIDTRATLRALLQARESARIQARAVRLARTRVQSTNLFLEAGRAQVRDVLEAQEALISAQNALTQALVRYRVAELEVQRDVGVLDVDENGIWTEYPIDESTN